MLPIEDVREEANTVMHFFLVSSPSPAILFASWRQAGTRTGRNPVALGTTMLPKGDLTPAFSRYLLPGALLG
jgi:hypothetical protein